MNKELIQKVIKNAFYKGFEEAENGDANCYTAWRECAGGILQELELPSTEKQGTQLQWVKASERLPEAEGDYFTIRSNGNKEVMYHSGTKSSESRWKEIVDQWLEELPSTEEAPLQEVRDKIQTALQYWKGFDGEKQQGIAYGLGLAIEFLDKNPLQEVRNKEEGAYTKDDLAKSWLAAIAEAVKVQERGWKYNPKTFEEWFQTNLSTPQPASNETPAKEEGKEEKE